MVRRADVQGYGRKIPSLPVAISDGNIPGVGEASR